MHKDILRAAVAATACLALPAAADDAMRLRELERRLETSLERIETLQRRLDAVELREPALQPGGAVPAPRSAALPAPTADGAASVEAAPPSPPATAAAPQAPGANGLALHGFADVGAGLSRGDGNASAPRGFTLGTFSLYMTPQLGERVKGLVELAFEFGSDHGTAIDVERLQLGYTVSDALTLWAGRFHTPYGYWNTAFHHGAQFQTALSRPRFLEFEDRGGILPSHSIGLWATGSTRLGANRLGYDVYAVNSNRIADGVLQPQLAGDRSGSPGVGFRAGIGLGRSGWTLGVHGQTQRIEGENASLTVQGRARLNMLGVYAVLDDDDWEVLGEYYRFRNRDLSGGSGLHGSSAAYLQVGRRVGERFTPYARAERSALDGGDPYFSLQSGGIGYRRAVAGLRYDINAVSAVKAEWSRTVDAGARGAPDGLALQYAVRF